MTFIRSDSSITYPLRLAPGVVLLILLAAVLTPKPVSAQHPTAVTSVVNSASDTTLEVNHNGSLLMSGMFSPATPNDSIPETGAGTRLMWFPSKAAFRVGQVDASQWDATNVGPHSTALGQDTKASGDRSTAMGRNTIASENQATAMGIFTVASGRNATAMGRQTTASAEASFAVGARTEASGAGAAAMGAETIAATNVSLTVGSYNQANTSSDNTLFVAGNGSASSGRSDALVLKKNGDFGLGPSSPVAHLHVEESVKETGATNLGRHAAAVENTSSEAGADVLGLKSHLNDPGNVTNFISFLDADEQIGTIQGTGGGIELTSKTADFAEELPVAEDASKPEPTELVGVRAGRVGLKTAGADRVMIVSRSPIMTGNATPSNRADDDRRVAVAFVGQVPAKVLGPVAPGDLVVASGKNDGTARAVPPSEYRREKHGMIVGQAWSEKTGGGMGAVTVAVGLGSSSMLAKQLGDERRRNDRQEQQIDRLEKRLASLERNRRSVPAGLPGSWMLGGAVVLLLLGGGLGAVYRST